MTDPRHTSGPWEAVEPMGKGYLKIIGGIDGDAYDDGRPRFTSTHVCDVIDNEDEAPNAALIAAAPDLLALAKQYASECADCGGTGRYQYTFPLPSMAMAQVGEPCAACDDIRAVISKAEGK